MIMIIFFTKHSGLPIYAATYGYDYHGVAGSRGTVYLLCNLILPVTKERTAGRMVYYLRHVTLGSESLTASGLE